MIVKADPDIDRLLGRLEPSVRRAVTELLTRGKVNVSEIAALLEAGRVGEAIQTLGIGFDDESMSAVREALQAAFSGGAKPVAAEFGLRFDVFDEHAVRWAEANAGRLITEINDETRRAVAGMVEQAVRDGVPPRRLARTIEQAVGLHTRYAQAVHNYKEGLLAQVTEQRAEELATRYANRLLRKRAETIARTETIRAMSEGQLDGWREAADEGVLQAGRSQREWVVTTDDRLCFPAGTLVTVPGGLMPIENVRPGDLIITPAGRQQIVGTSSRGYGGEWAAVLATTGEILAATANHRVSINGGWVPLREAQPGDVLDLVGNQSARVVGAVVFALEDMHDGPSLLTQLGVPAGVLDRVVPVVPVGFNRDPLLDDGVVDRPATDLELMKERNTQLDERISDGSLKVGRAAEGQVAAARTEPRAGTRAASLAFAAVGALEVDSRPSAGFGAVDPLAPLVVEPLAARRAVGIGRVGVTAGQRANRVAVCDMGGNDEALVTYRADLLDHVGSVGGQVAVTGTEPPRVRARAWRDEEPLAAALADDPVGVGALRDSVAAGRTEPLVAASRLPTLLAACHRFLAFCRSVVSGHNTVYDLAVTGPIPAFYANGILVHNCPECAPMEGQIVSFTDAFVSSEVAEGFSVTPGYEDRVTITGTKPRVSNVTTMTPPLHPNCRCAVSLVFDVD